MLIFSTNIHELKTRATPKTEKLTVFIIYLLSLNYRAFLLGVYI